MGVNVNVNVNGSDKEWVCVLNAQPYVGDCIPSQTQSQNINPDVCIFGPDSRYSIQVRESTVS